VLRFHYKLYRKLSIEVQALSTAHNKGLERNKVAVNTAPS